MKHTLLSLPIAACPSFLVASTPPNVVLLVADDLGYGELSCQNPGTDIPTPHIDSIAAAGVRFTQGYVTAPNCSPSRAGFLTGRIATRFGYEFNPIGARNNDPGTGLPKSEKTLARHLHNHGYTTAMVGKWHLGATPDYHPHRRGFDTFYGFLHEGHFFVPPPYDGVTTMLRRKALPFGKTGRFTSADGKLVYTDHMRHDEPLYDADNPVVRQSQPVDEQLYLTDALTREAVDFIGRHKDKPFFLYLPYNAVHSPLQGADAYMQKFGHIPDIHRRIFAAMLANLDDSVGAILTKLQNENLTADTIVVFLSDNGGPTRELTSSNLPLRGGKGTMYEGGLRVPFMLKWPAANLPSNTTYDHPVSSLDLLPTVLKATAPDTPLPKNLDGKNLIPHLTGADPSAPHTSATTPFFWRQGSRAALRLGDHKIVTMTRDLNRPAWQLYHLPSDPSESRDLSDSAPSTLKKLITTWTTMNQQMAQPTFR